MSLPQDLLFNISEYGQVLPDLSPEYINNVVSKLSALAYPVNWAAEIRLQELRSSNSLYPVVMIAYENGGEVRTGSFRRKLGVIIGSSQHKSRISQELSDLGIYNVTTAQVVFIPTSEPDTEIELNEAIFLKNIRPGLYPRDNMSMTPNDISNTTPSDLMNSGIFDHIPDDIEMISYLLRSGSFNLGELLQWLRLRARSCVDGANADLHHLIRSGVIDVTVGTALGFTDRTQGRSIGLTISISPQSSRDQVNDILRIMSMRGLTMSRLPGYGIMRYGVTSWDTTRSLGDIIDEFTRAFDSARMCYVSYSI